MTTTPLSLARMMSPGATLTQPHWTTTYLFSRVGLYLIVLFPIAIGFPTGYIMARLALTKSTFFRTYYWLVPIAVAVCAYLSTFYVDYQVQMTTLENEGYVDVRELISFGTYLQVIADQSLELTRNTQTYSDEEGDPTGWHLVWTVESGIVAFSAYRGWRRGIAFDSENDAPAR